MRLLIVGIAVAVAFGQGTARADDDLAYDVLVDHGVDLYERGDYKAAREAFAAGYAARADPEAMFYLAKSHQRAGDFQQALMYFDRFLEDAASSDGDREEAERYRAMVARHLASREVTVPVFAPELEPEPERPMRVVAIPRPREQRDDPRAWRQTMYWVSGATALASMGVALYAGEHDGEQWDRIRDSTKYTWWAGIGGAVYFYYTGFIRAAPPARENLRLSPAVAVDALGVSLELDF